MSVMTVEPPLPLTPVAGAIEVGPAAGLVEDADGGRVFLYGVLAYAWDAGDEVLRRLAAVQLVKLDLAKPGQVAAGFGVDAVTLWRWRQQAGHHGAGALAPGKRGPRGPSRLTSEVISEIQRRRDQGATLRQIGTELGLSPSTVRVGLLAEADSDDNAQTGHTQGLHEAADDPEQLAGAKTDEGGDADQPVTADDRQQSPLEVLAAPVPRGGERAMARAGVLDQAQPVFTAAGRAPLAGLLLGLPGLEASGLLGCAGEVYGQLPDGFYGLETVLLEAVFRTLAGQPRAEGATRIDPVSLGRVLGMDRAPEVKTIRRKLAQLASAGKAAQLGEVMAAHHIQRASSEDTQESLVLYVDGHIRAYQGTKKIAKTHSSRLRFPAPATAETWVSDSNGDPVLVVMSAPGAALTGELRRLLPELRQAVGDDRRVLVGFDRGGWSPALFAHLHAAGFDVLTWRKHPTEDLDEDAFATVTYQDEAGRTHTWELADTEVALPLSKAGELFSMRQVTRRDHRGRQAHILTTRQDLTAGEVAYRMGSRWRQENYFRYGRLHLDLDSHDTYTAGDDDPTRSVPNPAKREAHKGLKAARARLEREQAQADAALLAAQTPPAGASSVLVTNETYNAIHAGVHTAHQDLAAAQAAHQQIPTRVPLGEIAPGQQILDTETKLITHAIKMAAFNTITAIARAIRIHTDYARADDEAYSLARQVLTHSGDIDPRTPGELIVRLDPLPTGRANRTIAQLCEHLTATETVFPGTNLQLGYQIKNHP